MLNDRIAVARPIAQKLEKAEASANETISLIGQLIAEIPAARAKLGRHIPLTTGMDATESLAEAAVSSARGYRRLVEAHGHFAADRDDLGLRTVSWGDVHECPPAGRETTPPKLSAVA